MTRQLEDINFMFLPPENEIHISSPPYNILLVLQNIFCP